ncbi:Acid Phosphatase [Planctomycetes bacterium CA13]|uniref:Acid Phosphatase n=1 Tax=Novipirellula herctigrandis TaxID=2527986 RepID=A0A5C5YYM0_9BACT|nr:Acid Phosphatase [Planctomycetes bacterium CA13]
MNESYPKLIVFDLDFTLWDCDGTWCDCLSPPFGLRGGKVTDRTGRMVRLYDDVAMILDECKRGRVPIAVASRTEQPRWAQMLLDLLEITNRFSFAEIYPTTKLKHFAALQESSGIPFEKMLFFDDEMRNISEVSQLGVTSIHVADGLTEALFRDGCQQFAEAF